jgi:hypothetical protein
MSNVFPTASHEEKPYAKKQRLRLPSPSLQAKKRAPSAIAKRARESISAI